MRMKRKEQAAKAKAAKERAKMRPFFRTFLIVFVLVTVLLIPVQYGLTKLGDTPILGSTEESNLMDELGTPLVDSDSPFFQAFRDSERVNILLLGINDELTDTIMLGSYDMKNQQVDVISIPRDTYYEREGVKGANRKVNAIYYKGRSIGTAKAVSDILMGMPIHYYVTVHYDGVARIVDEIGGVPVNIPFRMKYDDVYDDPALHIYFEPGETVLKGEDAVKYLRFRKNNNGTGYPDGDVGRIKAQQEFMQIALKESLGFGLPKVVDAVMNDENIESDITYGIAAKLALKALGLSMENVNTYLAPGAAEYRDKLSFWILDEQAIEEMLLEIYTPKVEDDADSSGEGGEDGGSDGDKDGESGDGDGSV